MSGGTTYNYQVVAEDYNGSLTPAKGAGTTSNGAAALGVNTVNLVNCTLASNGTTTYTTQTPHSFEVGVTVYINGNADMTRCDGVVTIASTPSPTTFTSDDYDVVHPPASGLGGTAQVLAGNRVIWTTPSLQEQYRTIRYWIYRDNALVGVAQGNDSYYVDYGYGLNAIPSYVPPTPPTSATPGWLSTVITAGAGTKTLTLASAATTTATNQLAFHDTTPALLATANAVAAVGGGNILIPSEGDDITTYPFTTTMELPPAGYVQILVGGGLTLDESWVLNTGYKLVGQAGSGSFGQTAAFGTNNYAVIGGAGYPLMYVLCKTDITFQSLMLQNHQAQQWGLLFDGAGDGGDNSCGNVQIQYQDFYSGGSGPGSAAEVIRGGGFGHYFTRGGLLTGAGGGLAQEALQIMSSQNQGRQGHMVGEIVFDGTFFAGKGVKLDNTPGGGFAGSANEYVFENLFFESMAGPLVRANIANNVFCLDWQFNNVNLADPTVGFATPMLDLFDTSNLQNISLEHVELVGQQPVFAGVLSPSTSVSLLDVAASNIGIAANNYIAVQMLPINGIPQWLSAVPLSLKEQGAPVGATGNDILWADSASHTLKFNPNNTGPETIATTSDIDATWNASIPDALTTAKTAATWTPDKPITVTRIQAQVLNAPTTCSSNAIISITDGVSPEALTISAAANDSGPISQNYSAGATLTVGVTTPAAGCAKSPAQANVLVQYHLQ